MTQPAKHFHAKRSCTSDRNAIFVDLILAMFEKVSHGDFILAMFKKVCHGDNLFSVSYRLELWKSFLVPDFISLN